MSSSYSSYSSQRVYASERTARLAAPAGVVYGLLADAERWPLLLPAPVHVERMDFDGRNELLRLWDVDAAGERVRSFHMRRVLDPRTRSVAFELEYALRMGAPTIGSWTVEPQEDAQSLLTLRQERTLERLSGESGERSRREWDEETEAQLAQVKEIAERWKRLDQLLLSFEDSVHVAGPAELVYDFLYRIGDWPELVASVDAARVVEDAPGVQLAAVDGFAEPDGGSITTRTARLCFPAAARIVYKELSSPELIAAHSGEWSLQPDGNGLRVVCAQQVLLREEAVGPVLGEGTELAEARRFVRDWLGGVAVGILRLAAWHGLSSGVRRLR